MSIGPKSCGRPAPVALAVLAAAWLGCGDAPREPSPAGDRPANAQRPTDSRLLRDVTAESGIDFVHRHGGTGRKFLPEIMGAGGAVLDYDGDGMLDVYLVQSGPLPWEEERGGAENRLFRNLGGGRFTDVTSVTGVGDGGYGMGALAFDYDADGWTDLYVLNLGADVLLRNAGDGTFRDVTIEAGIDSPLWGSSAAAFDAEGDGDIDLYVVNYLDFSRDKHVDCGRPSQGSLSYCHPDVYAMAPDAFFRNRGDGSFEETTVASGLADTTGKGLGVVAAELTGDGHVDLYVANDSTPNFLYSGQGDGTFAEIGVLLGVGHNEEGRTEGGMGTTAGDADADGRLDLFVTNLSGETNALYLGGEAYFNYATREAGLHQPSFLWVGFGTDLLDLDNDRDLDLLVTNGHVVDNPELVDDAQSFRQPTQVFWNDGRGAFTLVAGDEVRDLTVPRVGRGTMTLDYDSDGRLDVMITFNNDRARLFRNEVPAADAWLGLAIEGAGGDRDAANVRVSVEIGGVERIDEKTLGSSYQTSGDPRLHFALGASPSADRVAVRFRDGRRLALRDLRGGVYYRLLQQPPGQPAGG